MAGLGERDRVVHRLAVADLADQDHVGRLPQRVLERDLPALGVDADLALRDDAVRVLVDELDRVLDRDDVAVAVVVAVAEQRRHRRRLAAAGRADEQHDAALAHDHVAQDRRKPQVLELRDRRVDRAQHHADAPLLHERVDAEAADPGRGDREVALLRRLELGGLLVVHHAAHELDRVLRRERGLRDRRDLAVDLERRREFGRDEQVGALLPDEQVEELVDELGGAFAFHAGVPGRVSRRRGPCSRRARAPRRRRPGCGGRARPGTGRASACRPPARSGSPSTSARPCSRGSGSGSPATRP